MRSTTLSPLSVIEPVEPHESSIIVRFFPMAVTDAALEQMREIAKPRDIASDCLRVWLRGMVDAEIARRTVEAIEVEEPAAWKIPWHQWNDAQLAAALAASYSWHEVATDPCAAAVLREVHRAVLTAVATRLQEFHTAIENSRRKRG